MCTHASTPDAPLFPLVYPLCQVLLGVAKLDTSTRLLPLRLIVCSLLVEVRVWRGGGWGPGCLVWEPLPRFCVSLSPHTHTHSHSRSPVLVLPTPVCPMSPLSFYPSLPRVFLSILPPPALPFHVSPPPMHASSPPPPTTHALLLLLLLLPQLMWSTGVYIPVAPLLLEALTQCSALPKPSSTASKPFTFGLQLKLSKDALVSQIVQTGLVKRGLDMLLDAVKSQFFSISLPELVRAGRHSGGGATLARAASCVSEPWWWWWWVGVVGVVGLALVWVRMCSWTGCVYFYAKGDGGPAARREAVTGILPLLCLFDGDARSCVRA